MEDSTALGVNDVHVTVAAAFKGAAVKDTPPPVPQKTSSELTSKGYVTVVVTIVL